MPSNELLLPGILHRESEFVNGLNGTCGPCALHTALTNCAGSYISTYQVYQKMRAQNPALCDPNGASTINGLNSVAQVMGFTVATIRWYGEPWAAWQPFVDAALDAGYPVVIEVANGQAFADWLTGKGENAVNLHYHYVCIVGRNTGGASARPEAGGRSLPFGYWVADGDNYDSGNVLQFYALDTLNKAQPCAALSVKPKVNRGTTTSMAIPNGWSDNGFVLTAPNGKTVMHGFRNFILDNSWSPQLQPLNQEYGVNGGTQQDFGVSTLWQSANGSVSLVPGPDWPSVVAKLNAEIASLDAQLKQAQAGLTQAQTQLTQAQGELVQAQGERDALQTQVTTDNANLAKLQEELTQAQAQPVMDPAATAALVYVKALKAFNDAQAQEESTLQDALKALG